MFTHLLQSAKPVKHAILFSLLANLVEVYCLSYVGPEAVAAYSLVLPWQLTFEALGYGSAAAVTSLYLRAHQHELQPHQVSVIGFIAASAVACVALSVCWLFGTSFFGKGLHNNLHQAAQQYLAIWLFATVPLVINVMALALLRAQQQYRKSARLMQFGAAVHLLMSPLLILPFTLNYGLLGAAIVQLVTHVALSFAIMGTCSKLIRRVFAHSPARLQIKNTLRHLIPLAGCAGGAHLLNPLAAFLIVHLLAKFGESHVGAFGLAQRLEMLALIGFYGLSAVAGHIFTRAVQTEPASVMPMLNGAVRHCFKTGALIAVALALATHLFVMLLPYCQNTAQIVAHYFLLVPISYGAYGSVMLLNAISNGIGKPYIGFVSSAVRGCFALLLYSHAAMPWFGSSGVFIALACANFTAAAVALFLIRKQLQCIFSTQQEA